MRIGTLRSLGRAVAAMILLPVLAVPQSIGPDEIRARTQPYLPTPSLTLRTQVELVEVPVVVRDRQHKAVPGLSQANFSLWDNGKKQDISAFSVENFSPSVAGTGSTAAAGSKPALEQKSLTPPRFVALCFDDLATDAASLTRAKIAAKQFVKTALAPGDRVAVVTTAWPKSTEFSSDVPAMLALIDKVYPNSRSSDNSAMQCPPIRPYEAYLIANGMDPAMLQAKVSEYRACAQNPPRPADTVVSMSRSIWEEAMQNSRGTLRAIEGLVEGLAAIPGRRMILLASSGYLSGNLESDEDAIITKALRAGVVINALGARGLYTVISGGDASTSRPTVRGSRAAQVTEDRAQSSSESAKDDGMAVLASGTGGAFYHDNNDLLRGFKEVGMVPEVMYVLGFSPSDVSADGRFHNLKVRLNSGSGYSLQARVGYSMPPKAKLAPVAAPKVDLDSAVAASDVLADLAAGITWRPDSQKGGVSIVTNIDLSRLKLERRQDRRVQQVTLIAVLRDATGALIAGQRSDVELNLTDATYTRLVASGGVSFSLTVKAPPGTYRARGVLVEGIDGKMVTSNQQLVIQ